VSAVGTRPRARLQGVLALAERSDVFARLSSRIEAGESVTVTQPNCRVAEIGTEPSSAPRNSSTATSLWKKELSFRRKPKEAGRTRPLKQKQPAREKRRAHAGRRAGRG